MKLKLKFRSGNTYVDGKPLLIGRPNIEPAIAEAEYTKKESPQTCRVCGKIFPSMKSLYGHMRLHTDTNRNLRGVKSSKSSKAKESFSPIELLGKGGLTKPITGWGKRRKRSKVMENSELKKILENAADDLKFLSESIPFFNDEIRDRRNFSPLEGKSSLIG